ncbi:MAG: thioredoxin domain-containing protein, partial [Rhodovibrionaceae bacterium]
MPENRLAAETSPYLLQHKENPVAWYPWGEEAFAKARAEDKPILLSVGYAACHWCHVMAHESFESEEVAALMNDRFVNVKVDREERPDLDAIYQNALALLGEQGGWPLTMFLTPKGEPFWGGTYFPPEPRYGRPGFPQVLEGLSAAYKEKPEDVGKNVAAIQEALEKLSAPAPGEGEIAPELTDQIAERILREFDPVNGGIGSAPKFPQPSLMKQILRAWRRTGQPPFKSAADLTLRKLCQGGIYDHLGGGFARYTVDARWLIPHFEKMLYDNAQILDLLTWGWQDSGNPLFEQRARETVDWLEREMIAKDENGAPSGAYAASYDADSEGEEGKFYVWSEAEIDTLLGGDAAVFKQLYDVTPGGNWEGKTILNRLNAPDLAEPETEASLAACRKILYEARAKRVWPGWDDKVLADWNGLAIAALARAAPVFDAPEWLSAAERVFAFVTQKLAEGDRLFHAWRRGQRQHAAMLEDYANMIEAALALFEATGEARYLDRAEAWTAVLDAQFRDDENGGYFQTAADAENLIVRSKSAADNAVPAGNGSMLGNLARLYYLTGKDAYRERAETLVKAFSGELNRNFFPLSTFLNGNELLQAAVQVAIVGPGGTLYPPVVG